MSVRIIAGSFRGRRLECPAGNDTRPLLDRIKQSLFDWLGQDCSGLRVADVCAGSGSFGFEAASRGAAEAHLIERAPAALRCLLANLKHLGTPPAIRIHSDDFSRVLPTLSGLDLIFCDPPFPWFADEPDAIAELLGLAAAALASDGRLLIRGERGFDLPPLPAGLIEDERRIYGRSWIAALRPL
jgi:16S rRNA (guanine966-N2)-methyltransferase